MARSVLIVEDDDDLRPEMVEFLRKRGYRAAGCGSLAAARRALKRSLSGNTPPQYIISDVGLPDGDGLELFADFSPLFPGSRWMLMSGSHDLERLDVKIRSLPLLKRPLIVEKPFSLHVLQRFIDADSPDD